MEGAFGRWKSASRKFVEDARAILAKHNIDLQGTDNIVWAPNKGHSVEYAKHVHESLAAASPKGDEAVKSALAKLGEELRTQ